MRIADLFSFTFKAFAELAWTTRCLICDRPGNLLCRSCYLSLPFIDQWDCCPNCGAPYGHAQCFNCNSLVRCHLDEQGIKPLCCQSVIHHQGQARRLVLGFKDQGERRMAAIMASMMAPLLPPDPQAQFESLCYIPASHQAMRRRGFDHGRLLAEALSRETNIPLIEAFDRPRHKDQRGLDAQQRFANMAEALKLSPSFTAAQAPQSMLLVDDVYTTGATMLNAAAKLEGQGVARIQGISFARA